MLWAMRLAPLLLALALSPGTAAADVDERDLEFFESRVRPILVDRCYSCHSSEARRVRGGLYLDSRSGWATGGASGPAVVPGDPDASRLVLAVRYDHEELEMPPRGKLPDEEIAALVEWVERGAPDPRLGDVPTDTRREIDLEEGRRFWSFRPVADPPVPRSSADDWSRTDVDRFLFASMSEAGLRPTADAAPAKWLRRLTFDLTGLPPTPEELATFLDGGSPDGAVDRLLASPAFGERWGRHWLDVVRFAESSGGGRSLMFPDAWRYRDYVIASFAGDLPFDRFVQEQLAGDLLPTEGTAEHNRGLVAAGFLALGPTNYELQDKERLRWDVIDEQVDTVGRAFLGMSLGCARCHDHKFDPIPTEDYYALAGVFGSTAVLTPGNVSGWVTRELAGPETDAWHAFQEREGELVAAVRAARGELAGRPAAGDIDRSALTGIVLDDERATLIGEWKRSTHVKGFLGAGYLHDSDVEKGAKSVTFTPAVPIAGEYDVRISFTPGSNRATNTPVTIDAADGPTRVLVNQRVPPPLDGWFASVGRHRFDAGATGVVRVSTEGTDGHVIVDAVQLVPVEELDDAAPAAGAELGARVARLEAELASLRDEAPPAPPRAMSVRDVAEPADEHVRLRGAVRELGPPVPRGFLQVCTDAATDVPTVPGGASGRLELARWLTDPDHPLTARVYVNRVWHHLFGEGLVRTVDNFGARGELPSHPELLDWLARRFVDDGWSTKRLVRRLVLSRAYGLAVADAPDADPENRLRSVADRRRLEAEAIRDAVLSVSGELDRAMGGPTIRQLTQYDNGYEFDSRRRSVYVPFFRNSVLELFDVFDVANANLVTGRRNASQVAPQALYLLNSGWVRGRAERAAERLLARDLGTVDSRLDEACLLALGRRPTGEERELFAARVADAEPLEAYTDVFHALFACLDFRYIE